MPNAHDSSSSSSTLKTRYSAPFLRESIPLKSDQVIDNWADERIEMMQAVVASGDPVKLQKLVHDLSKIASYRTSSDAFNRIGVTHEVGTFATNIFAKIPLAGFLAAGLAHCKNNRLHQLSEITRQLHSSLQTEESLALQNQVNVYSAIGGPDSHFESSVAELGGATAHFSVPGGVTNLVKEFAHHGQFSRTAQLIGMDESVHRQWLDQHLPEQTTEALLAVDTEDFNFYKHIAFKPFIGFQCIHSDPETRQFARRSLELLGSKDLNLVFYAAIQNNAGNGPIAQKTIHEFRSFFAVDPVAYAAENIKEKISNPENISNLQRWSSLLIKDHALMEKEWTSDVVNALKNAIDIDNQKTVHVQWGQSIFYSLFNNTHDGRFIPDKSWINVIAKNLENHEMIGDWFQNHIHTSELKSYVKNSPHALIEVIMQLKDKNLIDIDKAFSSGMKIKDVMKVNPESKQRWESIEKSINAKNAATSVMEEIFKSQGFPKP